MVTLRGRVRGIHFPTHAGSEMVASSLVFPSNDEALDFSP